MQKLTPSTYQQAQGLPFRLQVGDQKSFGSWSMLNVEAGDRINRETALYPNTLIII